MKSLAVPARLLHADLRRDVALGKADLQQRRLGGNDGTAKNATQSTELNDEQAFHANAPVDRRMRLADFATDCGSIVMC